ncbi:MAG: TolC family protein [Steroidobacteraceae bacterium]
MYRIGGSGPAAARWTGVGPRRLTWTRRAPGRLARLGALAAAALLGGCATYHALPLARRADLAAGLAGLHTELPPLRPGAAPRRINIDRPLQIDQIGLLAVLNDPALRTEQGTLAEAQAGLEQASILPNPTASLTYEALLGGVGGVSPTWSASLTEDVGAILTYHTRVKSARFALGAVNADLLWREWQVAQRARVLALDLYWGRDSIRASRREARLLDAEARAARAAAASRSFDLTALAPILAAKAAADQNLAALALAQLRSWQALDALLGLEPTVRFAIAPPALPPLPLPSSLQALLAHLPERRPDLVALRLGYRSADENVRTAIIGQFPAMVLGGQWDQDNTNTRTAGPVTTFGLPIFDRNQGQIAAARATRLMLHAQYQARLDGAVGTVRGLLAQARQLQRELRQALRSAAAAAALARSARSAYKRGDIDERALTNYLTASLERRLEVNSLERTLDAARVAVTLELGAGLPQVRIVPAAEKSKRTP